MRPLELAGITLERYPLADQSAKYELRFNLQDAEQGISGQVEYSIDLFDASTIARLVEQFSGAADGHCRRPRPAAWLSYP